MFPVFQRNARAIACALLLVAAPMTASAQETQYQPSHLAAARAAIAATHAADQFDQILPVLAEQAKALFLRANPAIVSEVEEVVGQVAIELAARRPELNRQLERIWAGIFSEEELALITEFYRSEVGVKLGENMPVILQDSLRSANIWRDALSTEIVTIARERLIERGHQF